jgi:lysophospholipase-2
MGFSQGGAVALLMLRSSIKLAAIIGKIGVPCKRHGKEKLSALDTGLSTYLPLRGELPVLSEVNKSTPILLCHGDFDPVVSHHTSRGY